MEIKSTKPTTKKKIKSYARASTRSTAIIAANYFNQTHRCYLHIILATGTSIKFKIINSLKSTTTTSETFAATSMFQSNVTVHPTSSPQHRRQHRRCKIFLPYESPPVTLISGSFLVYKELTLLLCRAVSWRRVQKRVWGRGRLLLGQLLFRSVHNLRSSILHDRDWQLRVQHAGDILPRWQHPKEQDAITTRY